MPRRLTELDQGQFEGLCELQCTKQEICGFFHITDKTLEKWCRRTYKAGFSDVFREKRGRGKIALRRAQFRLAQSNANMAIWLGKNWLGQKDEPDELADTEDTTAYFDAAGLGPEGVSDE